MEFGSGKIKVLFRRDFAEKSGINKLQCQGIEFWGGKMCFYDEDGDAIRDSKGSIIEVTPNDIYSMIAK